MYRGLELLIGKNWGERNKGSYKHLPDRYQAAGRRSSDSSSLKVEARSRLDEEAEWKGV
jgi:hypothetical protein